MNLIDTHSHLYDIAFDADRGEALRRAVEAGVGGIILPAIDSASHEALFELCRAYPANCFPAMGLHPTSVNENPDCARELELVLDYLRNQDKVPGGRIYAVGEVGLDLYWSRDHITRQMEVFEAQIEWALEFGLPLIIHTRAAWPLMIETLGRYSGRGLRGVMHSFSGSLADYAKIMECGDFLFGIGGGVTYKNSEIADLLPRMRLEDIVLETDCPYLTPVPLRGKRNESAYLTYICARVAQLLDISAARVAEVTTANARRMLGM